MNQIHTASEAGLTERLASLDLNLIVAFDALVKELNVTRAAERVGVTQSAMSHALRRLRDLLGDPLLVRGRSGMVLTPRAESLVVPLRSGLVTLARALAQPEPFDPATVRRSFCVASPDLFDILVIPPLLERVRSEAPGVDLAIVPGSDRHLVSKLETGEIDVAVVPQIEEFRSEQPDIPASGIVRRTLFRDRFTCLIRDDHPVIVSKRVRRRGVSANPLSLETYAQLSHAMVSPSGEGPGLVDQVLAQHGLARRIALRIPGFYSALAIVAKSDLILTAPTALARFASRDFPIAELPPPVRLPRHAINLVWHERFSKDPSHAWLRRLVIAVATQTRVHADGP